MPFCPIHKRKKFSERNLVKLEKKTVKRSFPNREHSSPRLGRCGWRYGSRFGHSERTTSGFNCPIKENSCVFGLSHSHFTPGGDRFKAGSHQAYFISTVGGLYTSTGWTTTLFVVFRNGEWWTSRLFWQLSQSRRFKKSSPATHDKSGKRSKHGQRTYSILYLLRTILKNDVNPTPTPGVHTTATLQLQFLCSTARTWSSRAANKGGFFMWQI
mgnify:CR=1 FL=1